jgi:uncharacterized protein YodC (DUF2158 family)
MSRTILPGEVVALRSGGPNMTLQQIAGFEAQCTWFEGSELRSERFDVRALRTVSADDDADGQCCIDNFG